VKLRTSAAAAIFALSCNTRGATQQHTEAIDAARVNDNAAQPLSWCTATSAPVAAIHHRGPASHFIELVFVALNAMNGEGSTLDAGWSVVTGREPDLCLARYTFTLNGSPRVAEFAFLRLPAPHLVPFNDQASDISDLGDSIIAASDGVSHGTGRRLRAWSETYAEKIHLARAMRNDRESMRGLMDAYVGYPNEEVLVIENDRCVDALPNTARFREDSRSFTRLGFTAIACTSPSNHLETILPSRHRR